MNGSSATLQNETIRSSQLTELAGFPGPAPTRRGERISSLDILRGFSLMGILVSTITSFSEPEFDSMFPLRTVHPVFSGPHWLANTFFWFLRWMFFEGKMRAIFAMLFGAGVILITSRAEQRGAGVRTADIFTRRNLWLMVIGAFHAYFIWSGDVLFLYGVLALLFLFPCRHLKPKTLFLAGAVVLLLPSALHAIALLARHAPARQVSQASVIPIGAQPAARVPSSAAVIANPLRPSAASLYADIAAHHHGYLADQKADAHDVFAFESTGLYHYGPDSLGMMLIGMALFQIGYLSAKFPSRTYALAALAGLGIGLPIVFFGAWRAWSSGFDLYQTQLGLLLPYDVARTAVALGMASAVLLLTRSGKLRRPLRWVANVGQMALTNYLLTSLCMKLLFVWSPLHWYGYMEYYKLYEVVACMWIVNLAGSTLWLRHFQFGPVEWVWRSLTYWQPQPMRLSTTPAEQTA